MKFNNYEQLIENGVNEKVRNARKDLLEILNYALLSVDPFNAVEDVIKDEKTLKIKGEDFDLSSFKNIYVVGLGKASVGMAQSIVYNNIDVKEGALVTNDSCQKVDDSRVSVFVGGHPIPNIGSIKGAEEILKIVGKVEEDDLLIVLISGGGSALFTKPRVSLDDLKSITELLLKSGADINEINTVRKHLSTVKGGQLAASCKGTIVSLIISDIVGDPMSFIASGPTFPDQTTFDQALKVLDKYDLKNKAPESVIKVLSKGRTGEIVETPKKNDPVFDKVTNFIVANNDIACNAAKEKAEELNYGTMLLTTSLKGEACDMGCFLADKALNYEKRDKNMVFISGGETTVTIHGDGKGGRNQEMVLSTVKKIAGSDLVFSSFATDGVDGMSDAAGAICDGYSLKRAMDLGMNPEDFLRNNDSYNFFKPLTDLIFTGPTGTNVMDIQVILVC
jgi:glycerate 2-kinase